MIEIIAKYFPDLTPVRQEQIDKLGELYRSWNEKINVISRKDIDNLYEHHVLHSMSIAKFMTPRPGTKFLDMGTGEDSPVSRLPSFGLTARFI